MQVTGFGTALLGGLLWLSGCVSAGLGTAGGYELFNTTAMREIGLEELRNLQFFTSNGLRLSTGEHALDDSISTEAGRLMKIQTRQQRTVEIPARTPGVLVELGSDWLDLDIGDGVVLRFREVDTEGLFECVAFNGQPIDTEAPETPSEVEYQGERFEVVSARPVYLEYYVRRVVNVDRANQTIGGKRIEGAEPRAESY